MFICCAVAALVGAVLVGGKLLLRDRLWGRLLIGAVVLLAALRFTKYGLTMTHGEGVSMAMSHEHGGHSMPMGSMPGGDPQGLNLLIGSVALLTITRGGYLVRTHPDLRSLLPFAGRKRAGGCQCGDGCGCCDEVSS